MAKAFGGMGGGAAAAPMMTNNGSPGGIRPMPRPAGLGGIEIDRSGPKQGFLAGQFGPQGSSTRYEMAMELLKSAMAGAAGSNNPALAFLTPIIGSAVGAKVSKLRDDAVASEQDAMTEALLGGNLNPQAQQALEVLNNPNAPDYLKQIAATMFKQNAVPVGQMAAPARRASGGSRGRSSGGGGAKPTRFTYQQREADGRWTGFNPLTGKREYIAAPEDPTATVNPATATPSAPAAPALPPLPADPVLPADPMAGQDNDLINKYLTGN